MLGRFGESDFDAEAEDEAKLDDADAADVATASGMVPKLGSFEVMNRSIDIMQAALARHQLAAYPPDVLIEVPRSACRSLDFHRAADLIDVGRKLAEEALDPFEAQQDSEPDSPDG